MIHWIIKQTIISALKNWWRFHFIIWQGEYWLERTRFLSALLYLSGTFGLGGTWGLLEQAECLGCENPSTSTRTPSTLTLVGECLEDNESSFKAVVFKRPAEPLVALLEGAAEPLDAIFWGLAEPLEAILGGSAEPLSISEEHLADSHGTWALADPALGFPEEVDINPGPPEEHVRLSCLKWTFWNPPG